MRKIAKTIPIAVLAACGFFAAHAQTPAPVEDDTVYYDSAVELKRVGVPVFAAPEPADTMAGSTSSLASQIAKVISDDLRSSGLFEPDGPSGLKAISKGEVQNPDYGYWKSRNDDQLVQGTVRAGQGGTIIVGCYLYDVNFGQLSTSKDVTVAAGQWRRAAHKCADGMYSKMTGEMPFFDSRIAYIAETGPKGKRVKRLAIMDSDGAGHEYITSGQATALTPRFSPDYKSILFLSYEDGNPRIYIYDVVSKRTLQVYTTKNPTFAPRWSPDGKTILFSMAVGGNTDVYSMPINATTPTKLTSAPGIDVGGSFSPDGKQIVFESDRGGNQQVYVMNADGSNQRRISFGAGRHATPEWSPRGDLIAFTRIAGDFRVGIMRTDGSGEQMLTDSWQDEAPTWAPNGRVIQFFRTEKTSGKTSVWQVDLSGKNERKLPTPVNASDPAWGPVLP